MKHGFYEGMGLALSYFFYPYRKVSSVAKSLCCLSAPLWIGFVAAFGLANCQQRALGEEAADASLSANANIRRFGAKGDGGDDGSAIQAAVDAGKGVIYFPPGTYRITKPIIIDLERVGFTALHADGSARVIMAGEGPAFKFIGNYQGSAVPSPKNEKVWRKERMPTVDGIEIVGEHPQANGIEATGTMQFTVTRALIRRCFHAIHLTGRNRNVMISDCHLYENRGMGVLLDHVNLHQINLTGCHISYNGAGGVACRGGEVRNLHITGCDIEDCTSKEHPDAANVLIDNTGGSIAEVAITGCTIQHGAINILIKGPTIPLPNVDERRHGHITITGNILSDVSENIHLEHVRGVVITGNTAWQGEKYNLFADHCTSLVIGPNNFDRNPLYRFEGADADAILFRDCTDSTITGLQLRESRFAPAGIMLENCDRFHLSGLTLLDCDHVGLLLKGVKRSQITGCMIRDDRPNAKSLSIQATGSQDVTFSNNTLARPAEIVIPVSAR